MRIICWGTRGSAPVCGPEFIKYGGETSCLEVRDSESGQRLIIDSGTGIRKLGDLFIREEVPETDLLFTHFHWDHIMGLPLFRPLFSEAFRINLYGHPGVYGNTFKLVFKNIFRPPHFPVRVTKLAAGIEYREVQSRFDIGGFHLEAIPLSHPDRGLGYKISLQNKTLVFLTDNELGHRHRGGKSFKDYVRFAAGADLLIHDSEYLPEEYTEKVKWGHSTYLQAMELAFEAGISRVGFYHHNQYRTDRDMDLLVEEARLTAKNRFPALHCFAVEQGREIELG